MHAQSVLVSERQWLEVHQRITRLSDPTYSLIAGGKSYELGEMSGESLRGGGVGGSILSLSYCLCSLYSSASLVSPSSSQ